MRCQRAEGAEEALPGVNEVRVGSVICEVEHSVKERQACVPEGLARSEDGGLFV